MSRSTLIPAVAAALSCLLPSPIQGAVGGVDPHIDPSLVRGGCTACHRGHGASRSPMLPAPQRQLCLSCHGSQADRDRAVRDGLVAAGAGSSLLGLVLSQPYVHPINRRAYSEYEPGIVTCTSCHSPHRGSRDSSAGTRPPGRRRLSPKNPFRFEYELCEECHGSRGAATQSFADISRLLHPGNPSYHPVEAPARESSPSVIPALAGREINCTDCHGNSEPRGPRGPHGSREPFILLARYATLDGSRESPTTYALCYQCHRREAILEGSPFEEHASHIIELQASCATCHNAHGSAENRALIRFGEETMVAGVSPSTSNGRLRFVSDAPGSGACYLTCHGRDHPPEAYGSMKLQFPPVDPGAEIGRPASSPRRVGWTPRE